MQLTFTPPRFTFAMSLETNKLSCPTLLNNFVLNQKTECQVLDRSVIRIKPLQGFGNQLNGIVQGVFIAALSNKCLQIDWKYRELTDSVFEFENLSPTPSKERTEATKNEKVSLKYDTIIFPTQMRTFEKNLNVINSRKDLHLLVHYRDRLCKLLRSANRKFFRDNFQMFLSPDNFIALQRKGELCLYFESCIMQGFLKSSAIDRIKQSSILQQRNMIALHIRTGDKFAFPNSSTLSSNDERIPSREIPVFFAAAKAIAKNFINNSAYFLATDSLEVVKMGKDYFGQKLITVAGDPAHLDLDTRYSNAAFWKLILDWFMLTESKVVIHGPWSTFAEKALLYKHFKKKELL